MGRFHRIQCEEGDPTSNSCRLLDPSPEKVALRKRQLEALLTPQTGTFTLDPGGSPDDLPPLSERADPQSPADPEQGFSLNKKHGTTESWLAPTEKQKTCLHPAPAIVYLADNITICHHCYGLLDENLTLIPAEKFSVEREGAEHRALPECEVRQLTDEPEAKHPLEAKGESQAA